MPGEPAPGDALPLEPKPAACQRLEAVLHLVIGSDLEDQELERARAHLAQCAACNEAARRARRTRQLYFEQALKESSEPFDLWSSLAPKLAEAGLLRTGATRQTRPERVQSGQPTTEASAWALSAQPLGLTGPQVSGPASVPGPVSKDVPAVPAGSRAAQPQRGKRQPSWRLVAGGLLGGGLAAAALFGLLDPLGALRDQSPDRGPGSPGSVTQVEPSPLAAGDSAARGVVALTQDQPAEAINALATGADADPATGGGLHSIPASERLSAHPRGFEFFIRQQPGMLLPPSGQENQSLVNWSYPR
jgi:hypothetical protein